jgi:hypothetical protein
MNRTAASKSTAKRIVFWLFVLTLFCDAANLADLVSPSPVLHEDLILLTSILSLSARSPDVGNAEQWQPHFSRVDRHTYKTLQTGRLVIDQDSPAIPADGAPAAFDLLALLPDVSIRLPQSEIPTDLLHIRHHSLLI